MSSTVHLVGRHNLPQDLPLESKPGAWTALLRVTLFFFIGSYLLLNCISLCTEERSSKEEPTEPNPGHRSRINNLRLKVRRKKKSARATKKYKKMLYERTKVAKSTAEKARDEKFYIQYASLAPGAERDMFWLNTIIEEGGSFFKIWKCEHRTTDGVIWHTDYLLVSSFSLVFLLLFLILVVACFSSAAEEKSTQVQSISARARVVRPL